MADELAVNASHAFGLCQYLTFSRSEREGRVAAIREVVEGQKKKLRDPHYTKDDVVKILKDLSKLVDAEVEKEFVNMTHNTFLLVRQLMRQTETKSLELKMNLSEIQNIELLKAVAIFEKEIGEKKAERTTTLLKDPTMLDNSLTNMSSDFVSQFYRDDLINLSQAFKRNSLEHNSIMSEMHHKIHAKDQELHRHQQFQKDEQKRIMDMEKQHFEMTKKIDNITSQLALKEAELEKKFQSTNTYLNMQKILQSKNMIIKRLRDGKSTEDEVEAED